MLLYCRHDEDMSKQDRFSDECGLTFALGQRIIACALIDDQSLVKSWCSVLSLEDLGVEIVDVYEVDDEEAIAFDTRKFNDLIQVGPDGSASLRASDYESVFEVENPDEAIYLLKPGFTAKRTWRFDLRDIFHGRIDSFVKQCQLDPEQSQYLMAAVDELNDLCDETTYREAIEAYGLATMVTYEDYYPFFVWSGLFVLIWSTVTGRTFNPWFLTLFPYHFRQAKSMDRYDRLLTESEQRNGGIRSREEIQAIHSAYVSTLNECAQIFVNEVASELGISRNSPCMCGSGKKFKRCCSRATMDEIANRWSDLPKR